MISIQAALLVLLLWIKCQSVQNQNWNGYGSGSSWDSYGQSYNYLYGPSAYDYSSSAPTIYVSTYPQSSPYDYYKQSSYNPYSNECQQPIVIVVNGDDDDCDSLGDLLSIVASLNSKPETEPIYIPYPIPVQCCDNSNNNCGCGSDYCYSECGCRNSGCCSSNSECCCDCGSQCDNKCGECKKRRSKSKCGRNSGCGCSNSDCGCSKSIKHKSDKCCRG